MASELPLRLAILWHMHQPDYRLHDHVLLPWTRLHAIKDYGEMLGILADHPEMRCTVNFVPSLLRQIRGYAREGWTDEVRELLRCRAEDLTSTEVERLCYWAGLLPRRRMVDPYPVFSRLLSVAAERIESLSVEEVRDLQVWYLLTWTGELIREREGLGALLEQGSNFSDEQKDRLVELHDRLVRDLYATFESHDPGSPVEYSTTPFYHPILPLLLDLAEGERAEPGTLLPDAETGWTEDVEHQLEGSIRFHRDLFGTTPAGCWPSEGSLSTGTLVALIRAGFQWTASDEFLLAKTRGDSSGPVDHCYPWSYATDEGSITLFFRDHDLSDRIGFVYSDMDPNAAADDFVERVLELRRQIHEEHGDEGLQHALLPVILDGENCWEWYAENGRPFLDALYTCLVENPLIDPVSMDEAIPSEVDDRRTLERIEPGSWIGGNFRIWIGGKEDNRAWEVLAETRRELMRHRGRIPEERFLAAWEQLLAAEGSDWFWWYSDENSSANDADFDALFRHRLQEVYRALEVAPPEYLDQPICHLTLDDAETGPSRSQPTAMHRASFDRENK